MKLNQGKLDWIWLNQGKNSDRPSPRAAGRPVPPLASSPPAPAPKNHSDYNDHILQSLEKIKWLHWRLSALPGSSPTTLNQLDDNDDFQLYQTSQSGTNMAYMYTTICEVLWWKQSRSWTKMKVVKWCWNKWNGHILVHIYHKQCEFIQKIRWKGSNGQLQWFNKATSGALCWKRQKNTKTRGTKTQITQNFEKVWPI